MPIFWILFCSQFAIVLASISVDVKLLSEHGAPLIKKFVHNWDAGDQKAEEALIEAIQLFCKTLALDQNHCQSLLLNESFRILQPAVPQWLEPQNVVGRLLDEETENLCGVELHSYFKNLSDCNIATKRAVRSVKLHSAFDTIRSLFDIIGNNSLIPLPDQWKGGVEGHTFLYYDKVKTLQELADDYRVERICEIGFNMGHSTVNWLTANPTASILTFDLTRQLYTSAAVNALSELFPGRVVTLITGDSALSVPNFAALVQNTIKCNLIFIDGMHTTEGALHDIQNMRLFANESYHRVIVDDAAMPSVRRAWENAVDRQLLLKHDLVLTNKTLCLMATRVNNPPFPGSYRFHRQPERTCRFPDSSDLIQDALFIGQYNW